MSFSRNYRPPASPPSPEQSTHEIDLTNLQKSTDKLNSSSFPTDSSSFTTEPTSFPSHMKLQHFRSPGGVNAAYRRIYSRRERFYNRQNPDLVAERLDMTEESPLSPSHQARERAEKHISYAYVIAGYAHSSVIVVSCLALVVCVILFARGVLADVTRKTRIREDELVLKAATCRSDRLKNGCQLLDDGTIQHVTPALVKLCEEWHACEKRGIFANEDAKSASVWSETIADIANAFTSRISSMTTLICVLVFLLATFGLTTASFGFFHNRYTANQPRREPEESPVVLQRDNDLFLTPRSGRSRATPRISASGTPKTLTYEDDHSIGSQQRLKSK